LVLQELVLQDYFVEEQGLVYSVAHQLLLNKLPQFTEADTIIFPTTEGLYLILTTDYSRLEMFHVQWDFQRNKQNFDTITKIALADSDYNKWILVRFSVQQNLKQCFKSQALLYIFKLQNHKFMLMNDFDGNELVLYTMNGIIYIPHCINNTTIQTIDNP
jgi:hypothetical protein